MVACPVHCGTLADYPVSSSESISRSDSGRRPSATRVAQPPPSVQASTHAPAASGPNKRDSPSPDAACLGESVRTGVPYWDLRCPPSSPAGKASTPDALDDFWDDVQSGSPFGRGRRRVDARPHAGLCAESRLSWGWSALPPVHAPGCRARCRSSCRRRCGNRC